MVSVYSIPESSSDDARPTPIPEDIKATYRRNVIGLTMGLADWTDPAVIQLSPEADAALLSFQDRVEPKLAARGGSLGHIADWAESVLEVIRSCGWNEVSKRDPLPQPP